MAKYCGTSNADLVDNLARTGVIKSLKVSNAMKNVDRANFCKTNHYVDSPQSIGYAVNLSAPHMHAHALELLSAHLVEGNRALDVGCGNGYLTACMAMMVGDTGKAIGIDHIPELVEESKVNIAKDPLRAQLLECGRLSFITADGRDGHTTGAPYDVIHVGAAAPTLPKNLITQLIPGGRMIVPVGPNGKNQVLMQVDKLEDGSIVTKDLMGVRFIPLTSKEKQWPK